MGVMYIVYSTFAQMLLHKNSSIAYFWGMLLHKILPTVVKCSEKIGKFQQGKHLRIMTLHYLVMRLGHRMALTTLRIEGRRQAADPIMIGL